jgi:transcriptional regulator with XRE-family HTH domain
MAHKGRKPNRLKKHRRICGYSQQQVARALGMKKANLISEWERGFITPNLDNLLKLCVLYQTLIEELYFERLQQCRKDVAPPPREARITNELREKNINENETRKRFIY